MGVEEHLPGGFLLTTAEGGDGRFDGDRSGVVAVGRNHGSFG